MMVVVCGYSPIGVGVVDTVESGSVMLGVGVVTFSGKVASRSTVGRVGLGDRVLIVMVLVSMVVALTSFSSTVAVSTSVTGVDETSVEGVEYVTVEGVVE